MFNIIGTVHADYSRDAHKIAAQHGRHSDSVTIGDHVPGMLYFAVRKNNETYGVFTLSLVNSPSIVGVGVGSSLERSTFDLGGFTATPGYGGAVLECILEFTDALHFDLTLDCFDKDGFLPKLYAGRGFTEYDRDAYDVENYAPLKDGSTPDVVYMRRRYNGPGRY